jgi:transcriptional regulator with GAF, ATPase, and Fis domain
MRKLTTEEKEARRQKVIAFLEKTKWGIRTAARHLNKSESQINRYVTTREKSKNTPPNHILEKIEDILERLYSR